MSLISLGSNVVPSSQFVYLEFLFNSTNGLNWQWQNSSFQWNFTNPNANPCIDMWEGVGCNAGCSSLANSTCVVIDISLLGFNLQGTLPEQFFSLTELTRLEISENAHLSGSIPESIGNMDKLLYLSMNANKFSSSIPRALVNLVMLSVLDLTLNSLTGSIPSYICSYTNLTSLSIANNCLMGTIPDTLGNCTNLVYLAIGNNQFDRNKIPSFIYKLQ